VNMKTTFSGMRLCVLSEIVSDVSENTTTFFGPEHGNMTFRDTLLIYQTTRRRVPEERKKRLLMV